MVREQCPEAPAGGLPLDGWALALVSDSPPAHPRPPPPRPSPSVEAHCTRTAAHTLRTCSAQQLQRWYDHGHDVHVVWTEDLLSPARAAQTMAEVAAFLDLPPFNFTDAVRLRFNTSDRPGYDTATPHSTGSTVEKAGEAAKQPDIQWLREYFAPHNAALAMHVGKRCTWAEAG